MKTLTCIYTALFSLLLVISSCSNRKKDDVKTSGVNEPNGISFSEYAVDSTYYLFGDTTQPAIKIHLFLNYPVAYKNRPVLDSLQQLIIASVATNATGKDLRNPKKIMQDIMEQQIANFRLLEKENHIQEGSEEEEISQSYSNEYTSKTDSVFNRGGIFCFSTTNYSFSGGAHGLETVKYTCVNLDNGTIIACKDIFPENYEELLHPIILEKLTEKQNLKQPKELEDNGFFDISDIKANNNFFIDEKGITFVYNPYEIAAYFVGISDVFIPYEDIAFILSDQSPVKRFLK